MARRVFYSFHYKPDAWRASQVRNAGTVEGNRSVSDNDWETITRGGDKPIQKWIDDQLNGRSCTVVLIGAQTAGRKWINYEIKKSWDEGKGLVGIYIHRLLNHEEKQSTKGENPFEKVTVKVDGKDKTLSSLVATYDAPYTKSTEVYEYIKKNLDAWVEKAIAARQKS